MERHIQLLQMYGIQIQDAVPHSEDDTVIYGEQFLQKKNMRQLLMHIGNVFGSPDNKVTASLFIKRYSVYIAALEIMSKYNTQIALPLSRLTFLCAHRHIASYIPSVTSHVFKQEEREEWRKETMRQLFAEHVTLLIEMLAEETRLPRTTMWAHVAFYIHVMYKKWMGQEEDEEVRKRLTDDFNYLINEAPVEWFGRVNCNPLQIQFCQFNHPVERNETISLRKVCCMNYKVGKTCYTCPRIDDKERIQKIIEVYQKA